MRFSNARDAYHISGFRIHKLHNVAYSALSAIEVY